MAVEKKPSRDENSSWSFDHQGEYSVDPKQRRERIAALALAALWVGLIFYNAGLGYAIRGAALFGLGVAAIWWPDALSQLRSLHPSLRSFDWQAMKGGRPSAGSARIAGWMILILPVLIWGVVKLVRGGGVKVSGCAERPASVFPFNRQTHTFQSSCLPVARVTACRPQSASPPMSLT